MDRRLALRALALLAAAGAAAGAAGAAGGCEDNPPGPGDCGETCLRRELGVPRGAARVIVFAQSSHLDWDWQMTFDGYYDAYVERILDAAHELLASQPRARFSIAEVDFLERHLALHPEQRDDLAAWLADGRLRVVGGAMTSPDTLLPAGESILRDFQYGREKLVRLLGEGAVARHPPIAAWLPDSFGHSPTVPTLLREAGYRYVAFGRLPGADTAWRFAGLAPPAEGSLAAALVEGRALDFVWRAPDGSEVLAHYLHPNYGVGDSLDNGLGVPGVAGTDWNGLDVSEAYVHGQIDSYLATIGAASPTAYVFVPVGNDFQLPKPRLLELLDRWNERRYPVTGAWAVAATFEDYARLVDTHRDELPVLELDGTPYWTGFYASRPELKQLHARAEAALRTTEVLRLWAPDVVGPDRLEAAWRQLVPSNHHDFLPGTANDEVTYGEQLPLLRGAAAGAESLLDRLEAAIARRVDARGDGVPIVVFNPAPVVAGGPVELDAVPVGAGELVVDDGAGGLAPAQVLGDGPGGRRLLIVSPPVPARGFRVLHVRPGRATTAGRARAVLAGPGEARLSNGRVELGVSGGEIRALAIDGAGLLAPGGRANVLETYVDDGGLYRLGAELRAQGCAYHREEPPTAPAAEVEVLEAGPLRARLRIADARGHERTVELVDGEPWVRFRTTARAPEGRTVTARFELAGRPARAEMGAPFGVISRGLEGPWDELYQPAQLLFAPLDADGVAPAVFASNGGLAWKATPEGVVEHILVRDARAERCDTYGSTGRDDGSHTIAYVLVAPADAGRAARTTPVIAWHQPLRGRVATAGQAGDLGRSAGLLGTDDERAVVHAAPWIAGRLALRIFRLDPTLPQTRVDVSALGAARYELGGRALAPANGWLSVPLATDVVTVTTTPAEPMP